MFPLVSVLMCSYNREKYIAEAVESVLASTYTNFELLIVDDGSKDKTVNIANCYKQQDSRMKIIVNQSNLGQFENRNKAASLANGKYIKYVDSDDIIYPHGLEVMVKAMEKYPEACIGFSNKITRSSRLLPEIISSVDAYREHFFCGGFLTSGPVGTIYNTQFFNSIGKFELEYGVASDIQFNLKAALYYPVVVFNRDLFWWRQHDMQEINLKEDTYETLNYKINSFFLEREDCPLTEKERKVAMNNMRNIYTRKVLKTAVKLGAKQGLEKYKKYNLTLADLLLSTMPGNLRRKLQRMFG